MKGYSEATTHALQVWRDLSSGDLDAHSERLDDHARLHSVRLLLAYCNAELARRIPLQWEDGMWTEYYKANARDVRSDVQQSFTDIFWP